jgi:hypothetical protein
MTYKTSLDTLAKITTLGVTVLFAVIMIVQYSMKSELRTIAPYTTVGLLLIYFIAFAFRPINYTLTADHLTIHRPFKDVLIPFSQIKSIEILSKKEMGLAVRTFGVGGLFGYYGKFASMELGSMTWYATRRNETVLVRTVDDKKIILTPDEGEKFVAEFKSLYL